MNLKGNKKKISAILIVILVIVIAIAAFFVTGTGAKDSKDDSEVTVEILQGSGSYDIINALDEAGLIKNKTFAKIYVKLFGPDTLQANTYVLNRTMTLSEMLDIISTGEFEYILKTKFTIIEGANYKDVVSAISEALGISTKDINKTWEDEEFLKTLISDYWFLSDEVLNKDLICPLEGYLYPNTYFVTDKEPTVESVTRQILDLTGETLSKYKSEIESSGKSVHEVLTLASIVENESLFEEDRSKIAGVFINRLNEGMNLQSDITVLYALGKKTVDVSVADTKVDSKYNTYKVTGLPIGPVSNPSEATIKDCLNYEESDYLYFFATEDGKVIYSKTYDEHLKAVDEYGWY